MKLLIALTFNCCLLAADVPRVVYSKSFPGSSPEYVLIRLDQTGAGEYREALDDDPVKFQTTAADISAIFELVDKLDRFKRPLESPLKVARMGMKTFRYENGAEKNEVKFNFSEDLDARNLQDWFERISESEQHLTNLQRSAKYDRLGINKALLMFESSLDRKRLVALNQFLPTLDRIANNESFLHMARERAAGLAAAIRASK